MRKVWFIILASLVASLSIFGPVAAQSGGMFTSSDGLFSAAYPDGWLVQVNETIVFGSSQAAIDASETAEALLAGEIVYTIVLPTMLPQINLPTTADPTATLETLISLGEFTGVVAAYPAAAVPAASAIIKDSDGLTGQMIALGFDAGTLVVLVEVGGAPGSRAAEVDAFVAGLRYAGQSPDGTSTAVTSGEPTFQWIVTAPTGTNVEAFGSLSGLTVGVDGNLYVLDPSYGIWKLDAANGAILDLLEPDGLFFADGIATDPDSGNLYIATWADNQVMVITPEGEVLNTFGGEGSDDGQFGSFSPKNIDIKNGEVYVSDGNEDASGNRFARIQVFDLDGNFLRSIDTTALTDFEPIFDVAPDGTIYVASFGSGASVYANDGRLLHADFGGFDMMGAVSAIRVADDGNLYVGSWDAGVMVFSPQGDLLGTYGSEVSSELPEGYVPQLGEFGTPAGLAYANGRLYMSDYYTGQAASVTAIALNGGSGSGPVTLQPTAAPATTEVRQWASFATGSSQYGESSWSFTQATGAPDTFECSDIITAWASASSTGSDRLVLEFAQAVHPTEVHIYQTYNPGSITRVELTNTQTGTVVQVPNSADPPGNTPCPGVFSLDVNNVDVGEVNGVIIYLDQTIGGSWNEIDAVELVGVAVTAPTTSAAAPVPDVSSLTFTPASFNGFNFSYPAGWTLDLTGMGPLMASDPAAMDITNTDPLPDGAIRIEFALPNTLEQMGLPSIGPARDAVVMLQGLLGTTGEIEELEGLDDYRGVLTHAEPGPNVPVGAVMIGIETAEGTVLMAIRTEQFDAYRPIIDAIINSIEYDL